MKKILGVIALSLSLALYAQEAPKVMKTKFSNEVLSQKVQQTNGKETTLKKILNQHKGKVLVIDFWASWCRDCIVAMPAAKELEKRNPEVDFVFLSLDRTEKAWKNGLKKYKMSNNENYWFSEGWRNKFNNYVDLNWIPRYIVVDQKSDIAQYYAISPEDPEIQKTINKLLNKE